MNLQYFIYAVETNVVRIAPSIVDAFFPNFEARRPLWGSQISVKISSAMLCIRLQFGGTPFVRFQSGYTSRDWAAFLRAHNIEHSMSRRGNCHDNAVAESFFNLLKRERIRRRSYKTREQARQDVFDYIEMFYNPKRKHAKNGMLSPVDFENRQRKVNQEGV